MAEEFPGQGVQAAKEARRRKLLQEGQEELEPITTPVPQPRSERPAPNHEWKHYGYDEATGGLARTALGRVAAIELPAPEPAAEDMLAPVGADSPAERAKEARYANPPMPDFSKGGHDPFRTDYPKGMDIPRSVDLGQLPPSQPPQAPGGHEQQ